MGILRQRVFRILCILGILAGIAACGMAGTEVGNPGPGAPSEEPEGGMEPSFASPTPTPELMEFETDEP